jgi:hypothetical protein
MFIALYMGGKIMKGEFGCQYSKNASYGFQVNVNTAISEIRKTIFQKIGGGPCLIYRTNQYPD